MQGRAPQPANKSPLRVVCALPVLLMISGRPFRGDEDAAVAVTGTPLQHHDRRRRTRRAGGHEARRRRGARCRHQGDARGYDDDGGVSRPAPPPVRSPEREGLLRHHAAPPIREVTVMAGPLRPHRPQDIQPLPPRADQAGENGPASRFPQSPSRVRPSAACQREHPKPSPAAPVTTVTAISQQTRAQRPRWSPAAGSVRPAAPASTCHVKATERPDLDGSNHGTEGPGWAPDRRILARRAGWAAWIRGEGSRAQPRGLGKHRCRCVVVQKAAGLVLP